MRALITAGVLAATLGLAGSALAADEARPDAPKPDGAATADALPPLPADRSVHQSIKVGNRTLSYTASVGVIAVRDEKGKKIGEVVYNSYILDGGGPRRPVTFAFNGGPGAATVYLDLGAMGPKRVNFGAQGDTPSTSAELTDNPETWLDFTDLVFINAIGTGFSRSLVPEDQEKKYFYAPDPDVAYLSRTVYDWLVKNGRLTSPKYIAGESYGGYRAPRIAHYLQTQQGVGVTGVVMISPYLDPTLSDGGSQSSPMGWAVNLPTMAAAKLERDGVPLTPEALRPIEDYAQGEFVVDFMRGPRDPAATQRIQTKITQLFGVDPALSQTMGGRIDTQTLLRELYRRQGKVGSRYDINVTTDDPYPFSYAANTGGWQDPVLDQIIAPTTSAMVDFDTRVLGWKVDAPYYALNPAVGAKWTYPPGSPPEAVTDLRQAIAIDPRMKVLIVHGYTDLSCPFFASQLIINQIPNMGDPNRIRLSVYPGGHMFYSRPDSRAALHRDAAALYGS